MNNTVFIFFYITAVGLTCGGLVASGYELATKRRASFRIEDDTVLRRLAYTPVIVLGGPTILMRNAVRGRILERRPLPFLFASLLIATFWSFTAGLFVLQVALSL
jgi:hypothetical protein